MNKKVLTLLNLALFGLIILFFILEANLFSFQVQALPLMQTQQSTPFLGAIYYGQEEIQNVFDHDLPAFNGANDNNTSVRHYDGAEYAAPIEVGYGYDGHFGIDYRMRYDPILAAATGLVDVADWSDKANHRLLYGLHVQMIHDTNPNYRVWYGHLSALTVQQGDRIVLSDILDNSRQRILGISGNTGKIYGCDDTSISENPLCSAHLHLEVRTRGHAEPEKNNIPVDPYGWIGSIPDPWAGQAKGFVSYPLWQNRPATGSPQYDASGGNGPEIAPPDIDLSTAIEIDDISQDGSSNPCWSISSDPTAINGTYFRATTITNTVGVCQVQWTIPKLTNTDDFDLYVHIPDPATALNATYTIHHANQESTASVVQAAYPNSTHDAWAYIGRYDFLADGTIPEYVLLSNETTDDDFDSIVVADAIRLIPTNPNTVLGFTHNDAATTTEDTPVTIDVLANDEGTGLNIVAVTQPDHGTVIINNDGPSSPAGTSGIDTVTYTPDATATTPYTDTFTYTAQNSLGLSDTATVTVYIGFSPTLLLPNQGATTTGAPFFNWDTPSEPQLMQRAAEITSYQFQVARDNQFQDLVIDATTTDTTYTANNLDEGLYYWRVGSGTPVVWSTYYHQGFSVVSHLRKLSSNLGIKDAPCRSQIRET